MRADADVQSTDTVWRFAGRTGQYPGSTGWCSASFPFRHITPCVMILQVKAAHQPFTSQDIGVGTGENDLTAYAPGAMAQ